MNEPSQWVPVELDIHAAQKFNEILPAGRILASLEVDRVTGSLRVTMDDGTQRVIPRQSKPS